MKMEEIVFESLIKKHDNFQDAEKDIEPTIVSLKWARFTDDLWQPIHRKIWSHYDIF